MMSGAQVGIERLPSIRQSDSREPMNCRNCRKRKIKCNRVRPSCEACRVFKCSCVYDAVPKKRGPKTEVLEALVKRVNGLEKELRDAKQSEQANPAVAKDSPKLLSKQTRQDREASSAPKPASIGVERDARMCNQVFTHINPRSRESAAFTDALLDTYFSKLHRNPYFIIDETATRRKLRDGHLPQFLVNAIHAVTIRYVPNLCGGHDGAIRSSQDYARRSRMDIDIDEPNIDNLQALLLLSVASFQLGNGKKSCMLLSHAVNIAFALELHRELPEQFNIPSIECESRRLLFWTCYLMDRFTNAGSKKPPLISDESIYLRLPASDALSFHAFNSEPFLTTGPSRPYSTELVSSAKDSIAILVEIARILGKANRYLAAGGVKGDSHFPWHAQSKLAGIRSDLDSWAVRAQHELNSVSTTFVQSHSYNVALSKLIYHLIHCLVYRPFLPLDLAELAGTGQHQSWQTEAVNICFKHADAIAELIDVGNTAGMIYWPAFVGYCLATAGTIHVHGVHYAAAHQDDIFASSSHLLSRDIIQLGNLQHVWAGLQHQCEMLQNAYASHTHVVQTLAANAAPLSPGLQMGDFFDRYVEFSSDGAYVTFQDTFRGWPQKNMPNEAPVFSQNRQGQVGEVQIAQGGTHNPQAKSYSSDPSKKSEASDQSPHGYPTPTADGRESAPGAINQCDMPNRNDIRLSDNQNYAPAGNLAMPPDDHFSTTDETQPVQQETMTTIDSQHGNPFWGAEAVEYMIPTRLTDMPGTIETDSGDDPFLSFLQQMVERDGLGEGDFGELELLLNEGS